MAAAPQMDVYEVLEGGRVGEDLRDASALQPTRLCDWCNEPIPADARVDAEVCGVVCRKRRWRFRRAVGVDRPGTPRRDPRDASRAPGRKPSPVGPTARFAYADPPYPGKADLYPERQEVDHEQLIARLEHGWPDGWALSTSAEALRDVLPLCPRSARVCVWRRRVRPARSRRALSAWEPLIVVGGRELSADRPQELLDVLDYRGRYDSFPGALTGMKPPEFAVWMFRQLGARAGDQLDDIFPGSGAITRAWELYTSHVDGAGDADAGAKPSRRAAARRDGCERRAA